MQLLVMFKTGPKFSHLKQANFLKTTSGPKDTFTLDGDAAALNNLHSLLEGSCISAQLENLLHYEGNPDPATFLVQDYFPAIVCPCRLS